MSVKNKDDKNTFLFSLDKGKIYSYNRDRNAIEYSNDYGPTFGSVKSCIIAPTFGSGENCIYVGPNPIQDKNLFTNESGEEASHDFKGDKNALSEDGIFNGIFASEIEVFQVIFET